MEWDNAILILLNIFTKYKQMLAYELKDSSKLANNQQRVHAASHRALIDGQ